MTYAEIEQKLHEMQLELAERKGADLLLVGDSENIPKYNYSVLVYDMLEELRNLQLAIIPHINRKA